MEVSLCRLRGTRIVYVERPLWPRDGFALERQRKGWSRGKKVAPIAGSLKRLLTFGRSRDCAATLARRIHLRVELLVGLKFEMMHRQAQVGVGGLGGFVRLARLETLGRAVETFTQREVFVPVP